MKIGYARVSTAEQNLDLQLEALEKEQCDMIFKEKISAVKERPELKKMLDYLRDGDTVVIWKLDRLGRTLRNLVEILDTFKNRNIELISLSDGINSNSPIGQLFLQISGMFAEFERNIIIERTRAGLASARNRGVKLGRPKGISEKRKQTAITAQQLYSNGEMTIREICRMLNISTATLYSYLNYKGEKKKYNYGRRKKIQ